MKKLLIGFALIIGMFGYGFENSQNKVASRRQTNLPIAYAEYNKDYFLGQLPKDSVVKYADLSQERDLGITYKQGLIDVIVIDPESNPVDRQIRLTLLHEMCHIKVGPTFDSHGIDFQFCMVNLASHGAFHDLW